jgi:cell division septal protein FtsQ
MSSNAGATRPPRAKRTAPSTRADRRVGSRRRRRLLVGAVAVGGGALALWFLATGPLLSVRTVELRGQIAGDVTGLEEDLERAAGQGTVLRPSVGAMRAAAATHPWVESISVSRDLPLGLVVRVTPTRPAAVATDGEASVLVAPDGRVLGPAEPESGLARVALSTPPPKPGQPVPDHARGAVALAGAAAPEVAQRLRGLRMRGGRLEGRLTNGPELRFGAPDDVVSKAAALTALLSNLSVEQEQTATYIDLSVADRPTVGGLPVEASPDETGGAEVTEGIDP